MLFFVFLVVALVVWVCLLPLQKHLTFWSSTAIVMAATLVLGLVVLSVISKAMFGG